MKPRQQKGGARTEPVKISTSRTGSICAPGPFFGQPFAALRLSDAVRRFVACRALLSHLSPPTPHPFANNRSS
jgi:hypothetical protein